MQTESQAWSLPLLRRGVVLCSKRHSHQQDTTERPWQVTSTLRASVCPSINWEQGDALIRQQTFVLNACEIDLRSVATIREKPLTSKALVLGGLILEVGEKS